MAEFEECAGSAVSARKRAEIVKAVKQAASDLLRSRDADAALNHYVSGATVASNGFLYPSFDAFATEIREFYSTLHEIEVGAWDDVRVDVLSTTAAVFTATFRWCSTDTAGERFDLRGVWSAVFVRDDGRWKIRARHESFLPSAD